MRKLILMAMVAIMVLGASLVQAEDKKCLDQKEVVGTWKGFLVKDLLEEEGDAEGVEMDVLSSGEFMATAYGQKEPFIFEIKMKGDWKLDCTTVVSKVNEIAKLDVFVDEDLNLSEEETAASEKQIPDVAEAIRKGILENPDFKKEHKETVIYVDAQYMITKDESQKLYLYGKKK